VKVKAVREIPESNLLIAPLTEGGHFVLEFEGSIITKVTIGAIQPNGTLRLLIEAPAFINIVRDQLRKPKPV
jgi:hypothetical protein